MAARALASLSAASAFSSSVSSLAMMVSATELKPVFRGTYAVRRLKTRPSRDGPVFARVYRAKPLCRRGKVPPGSLQAFLGEGRVAKFLLALFMGDFQGAGHRRHIAEDFRDGNHPLPQVKPLFPGGAHHFFGGGIVRPGGIAKLGEMEHRARRLI